VKANTIIKNGNRRLEPRTAIGGAIDWLRRYVDEDPYTDAAREVRRIINGLEALHNRPGLDELLALVGQIAKTDQGLQEINRAKIKISQPEKKMGEER
jgi:hypothetical protein